MNFGKVLILVLITIVMTTILVNTSYSLKFRSFNLGVEDVEAFPGEVVIVNGTILNNGMWWLHYFNLTASDLPFNYKLIPEYFEEVRIYREWNPIDGVYRTPANFTLIIDVPENASGIYKVNITGQEHQSFYKVSNSTEFILKIISLPNISLSDIIVPENITAETPFGVSMIVNNSGVGSADVNISVKIPQNWNVSETMKSFKAEPNTTALITFTVTPSNISGQILALLEYQFLNRTLSIIKNTSVLTPMVPEIIPEITPPPEVEKPVGYVALVSQVLTNPIILGIIIVIIVIVIWYIVLLMGKRKKKSKGTTNMATT